MKTHEQFAEDLALYALNELTGSERQEFEQHLETCAVVPPRGAVPAQRSGIAGAFDSGAESSRAQQGPPDASHCRRAAWRVGTGRRESAATRMGMGLGSGAGWRSASVRGRQPCGWRIPGWEKTSASLTALHRNTSAQLAQTSTQLAQDEERLRLLSAPDAVQVSLNPQAEPRKPHATAIYSPAQKRLMLVAGNLAPVPAGKAYELWLIPMQGAPMPAGMFKPDEHGNAVMMDHPMPEGVVAKAFAVTLEDEAGSDKPTTPILIVGAGE